MFLEDTVMKKREMGSQGWEKVFVLRNFMLMHSRIEKGGMESTRKMGSLVICDPEEGEMRQPLGRTTSGAMSPEGR